MLPKYDNFKTWYFNNHNKEQLIEIKEAYYEYLKILGYEISFVDWYTIYKDKNYMFSKKLEHGICQIVKTITSKHPPVGHIKYGNIETTDNE